MCWQLLRRAEQPVCEDAKDLPPCEQQATAAGWRLHACVQQRRGLEHELEHQWQREVIECFRRGVAAIDHILVGLDLDAQIVVGREQVVEGRRRQPRTTAAKAA